MNSGWVQVQPDYYHSPFYVWCDTNLRDGVGVTVFRKLSRITERNRYDLRYDLRHHYHYNRE